MARIVIKTAHRPYKISTSEGEKKICMCGLSKNQPFCDESHHKTDDEKPDGLYQYDEDGKQSELETDDCEDECCGGCCGDECCEDEKADCKDGCCEKSGDDAKCESCCGHGCCNDKSAADCCGHDEKHHDHK